jgi:hypothetical protein
MLGHFHIGAAICRVCRAFAIFTRGNANSTGITVSWRKRFGAILNTRSSSQIEITQYASPSRVWTRRMKW